MFVAKFYATARYNIMFKTIRPWGVSAAHMTLLLFENIFLILIGIFFIELLLLFVGNHIIHSYIRTIFSTSMMIRDFT